MNNSCNLYPFNLGDKRLNQRAGRIVQAALEHAGDSIPTAAGSLAAADATYRFLDNPNVDPHAIDDAHTRSTVDLAARYPGVLLIAQDTTDADFTSPVRNGRLGQLATPSISASSFTPPWHCPPTACRWDCSTSTSGCVPPTNAANARIADAKKRPTRNRNAGSPRPLASPLFPPNAPS